MRTEMETPRAGNEQGLVIQRIWSTDGVLVATCIQEPVNLKRDKGREVCLQFLLLPVLHCLINIVNTFQEKRQWRSIDKA